MIAASADITQLTLQLTQAAEALAKARAQTTAMRRDESRWRRAGLLWPLFGLD